MDNIQFSLRSLPHGKAPRRSRSGCERSLPHLNEAPIRGSEENHASPTIPKVFASMLKTTTETGEEGLFAIKQPRVPHSPRRIGGAYRASPLHKSKSAQTYGGEVVDDRRRLPSYARDASSEVISMYETASQKSADRTFNDPDYRSYSMTQTYSTYSLSNHRSYTSLRSQPERSVLQRPRSPFAYPSRLKRPGFRPASPALTDGDGVDYSKRAEIERVPYGASRATSSPLSLYAERRRPLPTLRPDANRSTPSLLSQSSPARRSPGPYIRQGNSTPTIEWQRRIRPTSISISPARSNFSLTSSVNQHQVALSTTTITTPGKPLPSSPLYYDYTEDFDIGDYIQPQVSEPLPQFQIERTIPEDRPLSSGWQSKDIKGLPGQDTFSIDRLPDSTTLKNREFQGSSSDPLPAVLGTSKALDPTRGGNSDTVGAKSLLFDRPAYSQGDRRIIGLSGLGLGAQELNDHVEEAFGLVPSPSFELFIPGQTGSGCRGESMEMSNFNEQNFDEDDDTEPQSIRTSSYSFNNHLQQFPPPPVVTSLPRTTFISGNGPGKTSMVLNEGETSLLIGRKVTTPRCSELGTQHDVRPTILPAPQCSLAIDDGPGKFTLVIPNKGNSSATDSLILTLAESSASRAPGERQIGHDAPKWTPPLSLNLSNESPLHALSSSHQSTSLSSSKRQLENERRKHDIPEEEIPWTDLRDRGRREEAATAPRYGESSTPNFSHQISRRFISRSEFPMLAPKPISPARQLKLKNSVPQLMKALPPLPPEQSILAVSSPHQLGLSEAELPCRFSPLVREGSSIAVDEILEAPSRKADPVSVDINVASSEPVEHHSLRTGDVRQDSELQLASPNSQSLPKLKLKLRSSVGMWDTSPPDPCLWNLEENCSWSSQNLDVDLPPVTQPNTPHHPKPPKFKLKIIRASSSTLGTIRVTRDSCSDIKHSSGLHLRNPIDLFTPKSGIDGIFRQVSKQLHARKESANSTRASLEENIIQPILHAHAESLLSHQELSEAQTSPASTASLGPPNVRSCFSDDSSKLHPKHNMRKRLTDFKARINIPYSTTAGSQSFNNMTWRDPNGVESLYPSGLLPTEAHQDLPFGGMGLKGERAKRLGKRARTLRFRAKISEWLRGARSAIRARGKSRHAYGS